MTDKNDFPYNLLDDVAKAHHNKQWDAILPSDFKPSLAYVLAVLPEREVQFISEYYQNGKSYKELSEQHNISRDRVRQIIVNGIQKLARPSRYQFLELGVQGIIQKNINAAQEKITNEKLNTVISLTSQIAKSMGIRLDGVTEIAIDDLDLSVRSFNCLARAGIRKTGDIIKMTTEELTQVRNIGKKGVDEVIDKMHDLGLLMKDEKD